jgi:hypothetical protein
VLDKIILNLKADTNNNPKLEDQHYEWLKNVYKKVTAFLVYANLQLLPQGRMAFLPLTPEIAKNKLNLFIPYLQESYSYLAEVKFQSINHYHLHPSILLSENLCQLLELGAMTPIDAAQVNLKYLFACGKVLIEKVEKIKNEEAKCHAELRIVIDQIIKRGMLMSILPQFSMENIPLDQLSIIQQKYMAKKLQLQNLPLYEVAQHYKQFNLSFLLEALLCKNNLELFNYFKEKEDLLEIQLEKAERAFKKLENNEDINNLEKYDEEVKSKFSSTLH